VAAADAPNVETAPSDDIPDTSVVTTDQSMSMAGEGGDTTVTGIGAPDQNADVTPDTMGSTAPVEGATGEETSAVVEDTTGAAVEAPVDEPTDDDTIAETAEEEK